MLARCLHATLGHLLLGLVLRDACRFVDQGAAIFRPRRDDESDASLFDDRIGLGTDARAKEELDNVAQATRDATEQILTVPAAVEPPGDHNVRRSRGSPGNTTGSHIARKRPCIKSNRDFGHASRAARLGTIEDDILHGSPA